MAVELGTCVGGHGLDYLDDTVVEDDVMIGAGSLVPPRKRLESGFFIRRSPVKQVASAD